MNPLSAPSANSGRHFFPLGAASIPDLGSPRHWGIYARKIGEKNSAIHFHDCDEIYYVLEGRARVRVGAEEHEVKAMDYVFIPAGTLHGTVEVLADYKLLFIEGRLRGRKRIGHLRAEKGDEPFSE